MLTGNRNVDMLILSKLEDVDLVNVCKVNKIANDLCNDQGFWMNKILNKFPEVGLKTLKRYKRDRTWSEYYIDDLRLINRNNAQEYLHSGSLNGRLDYVMIAKSLGADIRDQNYQAVILASGSGNLELVKYLVSLGADIRSENDESVTYAIYSGNLELVKYLVSLGANIRSHNNSPVRYASESGKLDIVKYLISLGSPDPRNL